MTFFYLGIDLVNCVRHHGIHGAIAKNVRKNNRREPASENNSLDRCEMGKMEGGESAEKGDEGILGVLKKC